HHHAMLDDGVIDRLHLFQRQTRLERLPAQFHAERRRQLASIPAHIHASPRLWPRLCHSGGVEQQAGNTAFPPKQAIPDWPLPFLQRWRRRRRPRPLTRERRMRMVLSFIAALVALISLPSQATAAEMTPNQARQRVIEIINQPVTHLPRTDE